ncbi:MAG: hypothetical protein PHC60_02425 [Heliobacteriaceae bacterium]|nr:hypothetical protein [Heliobacteriaceae bacterium]MDD4587235.1 hypothetical protein [Heliobacteriaceae bacterium]
MAAPEIVTEWLAVKGKLPATETAAPAVDRREEPAPVSRFDTTSRPVSAKEPNTVAIFVTDADSSEMVAKKLQVAGIIPDAVAFNRFLMAEGYARRIQNGNHYLTAEMTAEELAKRLAGMR